MNKSFVKYLLNYLHTLSIFLLLFLFFIPCSLLFWTIRSHYIGHATLLAQNFTENIREDLIDSDFYAIQKKADFLQTTSMFEACGVYDNHRNKIFSFGEGADTNLTEIKDDGNVTWGYFNYRINLKYIYGKLFSFFFLTCLFFTLFMYFFYINFKTKLINEARVLKDLSDQLDSYGKTLELTGEVNFSDVPTSSKPIKFEEIKIIDANFQKFIRKLVESQNHVKKLIGEQQQKKFQKNLLNLTRQLSHDIRSPLAALKAVRDIGGSNLDPDQAKLLTMSIDRITDIANTILPKVAGERISHDQIQSCFLWMLVDQIISEKRVEHKSATDVEIKFTSDTSPFETSALCRSGEFMRSVSNIINNSIEAKTSGKKLKISVVLTAIEDEVLLTVVDNGRGMAPDVLARAFDQGFTFDKKLGTGLGLFQVKKAVESWNGTIQIESKLNDGTSITIRLKKSPHPEWLINEVKASDYQNMVVLDDEEYVFNILRERFGPCQKKFTYFKRIDDFQNSVIDHENTLFFIDQDLKQGMTGIELIQKYSLHKKSILLTGNYDDKFVQQKSADLGLKILPKPLINEMPFIA